MRAGLRKLVWRRAGNRCEYCRSPQTLELATLEIDHVIATKHGGPTASANLALACFLCNLHKGPNIAGIDPASGSINGLYHPRRQRWATHFSWLGAELRGRTAAGRTTVEVLRINEPLRAAFRAAALAAGAWPAE